MPFEPAAMMLQTTEVRVSGVLSPTHYKPVLCVSVRNGGQMEREQHSVKLRQQDQDEWDDFEASLDPHKDYNYE